MNIAKTIRAWGAYRTTVRELNSLDNRGLNDLGITRSDITRLAREHTKSVL